MAEQHFNIKTNNSEFAIELFELEIEKYSEELANKLGDVVNLAFIIGACGV